MTWAALAAEIVASRITGEPMPVEGSLLEALEPSRFLQEKREGSANTSAIQIIAEHNGLPR